MRRGRKMLLNTILLTATSLVMRTVAMSFNVYLSNRIGASGIGLYQLIMSASMLSTTFALSGVRFATTRLVSEEIGKSNPGGVRAAVKRCLIYASGFGCAAMLLMFFGAPTIGNRWIGDARTVTALRILALSLPAFSLSGVLSGYFTAVSRVVKSAAVSVFEQLVRIAFVAAALSVGPGYGLESACAIIVAGGVLGEIVSFVILYALYVFDRRRYGRAVQAGKGLTKRMAGIAMPLALAAYARVALSTMQHMLVPRGLKKYGASSERALADYGILHGMVFPVIMFPSALFYSLAELIVPELTDAQVQGRTGDIERLANRTLRLCLCFSIGVAAILFFFSNELGLAIYSNADVGRYMRILSVLMPVMYMDCVTDGMLRGLGLQIQSMRINILDSVISVALVYILLPKYAVSGYLFMICFTEVMNFALSIWSLTTVTRIRFDPWDIAKTILSALGAVNLPVLLLRLAGLTPEPNAVSMTVFIILSAAVFIALLIFTGCLQRGDLDRLKKIFGLKNTKISLKRLRKNV